MLLFYSIPGYSSCMKKFQGDGCKWNQMERECGSYGCCRNLGLGPGFGPGHEEYGE